MKKYNIVFQSDQKLKFILDLEEPLMHVDYSYQVIIYFVHDFRKYSMGKDTVFYYIKCLQNLLDKALDNKLQLHESITQDIGYLYNENLQRKPGLVYDEDPEGKSWVGYRYYFWMADFAFWIYNDNNNDIILEITPCFPGEPKYKWQKEPYSPEEIANFLWYEEWIKTYKPFLITKISRDTAQAWLTQANDILQTIRENVERMERKHLMSA